ncbi:MAG: hypothetical protein JNM27_17105 [Leptospirales bacterium]|nr:hypothetical protein [Leptospirales bacterium]
MKIKSTSPILFLSFFFLTCTPAHPRDTGHWDSVAKYLAGMEPSEDPSLVLLSERPEWKTHKLAMDKMFTSFDNQYLSKMRPWAEKEIGNPGTPVLFYPFGGPEIIVSQAFFPNVSEFIMCGLEAPGLPPDPAKVQPSRLNPVLTNLRTSLQWLTSYTYFQTIHMDSQLKWTDLSGTLPVMLVFLARTGNRVTDVTGVFLGSDGKLYELEENSPGPGRIPVSSLKISGIPGARITFVKNGTERNAYYFSFDASDPGMKKKAFFFDFLRSRGDRSVMLKAASYLLHWGNFPTLKAFILNESRLILQDDTGIPFKDWDRDVWKLTLYGNYQAPIPQFAGQLQRDLLRAYADKTNVRPLPFEIGYTAAWRPGISSMVLARKQK